MKGDYNKLDKIHEAFEECSEVMVSGSNGLNMPRLAAEILSEYIKIPISVRTALFTQPNTHPDYWDAYNALLDTTVEIGGVEYLVKHNKDLFLVDRCKIDKLTKSIDPELVEYYWEYNFT